MHLSTQDYEKLLTITEVLHHSLKSETIREQTGCLLLKLLKADYFTSFIGDERIMKLERNIALNITTNITTKNVAANDLHHGLTLYAEHHPIGSFIIGRVKGKPHFNEKEHYLFDRIKPHFYNAMRNVTHHQQQCNKQTNRIPILNSSYLKQKYTLTQRESEVILEILQGKEDKIIAKKLQIAFSTLRSHVNHIFAKLKVNNRSLLLNRIYLDMLPVNNNRLLFTS